MEGFKLGLVLGTGEGFIVGVRLVGFAVGRSVAFFDGTSDGTSVGVIEGTILGFLVGEVVVGFGEGSRVGFVTGFIVGPVEGFVDGSNEGFREGLIDGRFVGFIEGLPVIGLDTVGNVVGMYVGATDDLTVGLGDVGATVRGSRVVGFEEGSCDG